MRNISENGSITNNQWQFFRYGLTGCLSALLSQDKRQVLSFLLSIKLKSTIHSGLWIVQYSSIRMVSEYLPDQNLFVYHHKDQINHEFGPQQSNCNLKPSEKRFRLTRANHWGQQQLMGGLPVSDYSLRGFEFLLKINFMFDQIFFNKYPMISSRTLQHCFYIAHKSIEKWDT